MGKPGLRHMARVFTAPGLMRAHRIATACKGAIGAIPAIANSPATPNAWPPRAVLSHIADQSPLRVRPPAARRLSTQILICPLPIYSDPKTDLGCRRPGWSLHADSVPQHAPAFQRLDHVAVVARTVIAVAALLEVALDRCLRFAVKNDAPTHHFTKFGDSLARRLQIEPTPIHRQAPIRLSSPVAISRNH